MPLGVCCAVIIKCAAIAGTAAVEYIELSLICVCTNRKQQIPELSMYCEYKLGAQRGQGIWAERRECNMLTGNGGNKKQRNREKRRL